MDIYWSDNMNIYGLTIEEMEEYFISLGKNN